MLMTSVAKSLVLSTAKNMKDFVEDGFFLLSQVGYSGSKKYEYLKYWPCYLSGAFGVASAVAAVAYGAMNNIPLAVFHGVIGGGCLLIAGVVHVFIPLKRIEVSTAELQKHNEGLKQNVTSVASADISLQKINMELMQQIKSQKEINEKQARDLEAHMRGLEAVSERLLRSNDNVQEFKVLLESIQSTSTAFQLHVKTVQDLAQNIQGREEAFAEATNCLHATSSSFSTSLQGLQEQHSSVTNEYQAAMKLAENLQSLFKSVGDMLSQSKAVNDAFKGEIARLNDTVKSLRSAKQDIENNVAALKRLAVTMKKTEKKRSK